MSLLETLMLIGLGFALAALLGLFVGRLVWNLGLRTGARRIQRQVPVTVAELQSDRDRMRAEYAMLSRKLELKHADLKARLAESTAEVMRHRNRIELLVADLGKRTGHSTTLDLEVQRLLERITPLENELAARTAALRVRDEKIAELAAEIAKRDKQLASPPAGDLAPVLSSHQRLAQRIDALTDLSRQIAKQRRRFARDRDALAALQGAAQPELDLQAISVNGQEIEEKLVAAESETEALVREMGELDETMSRTVNEISLSKPVALAAPPSAERPPPRLRGIGNVVSFAARLKTAPKDVQN